MDYIKNLLQITFWLLGTDLIWLVFISIPMADLSTTIQVDTWAWVVAKTAF